MGCKTRLFIFCIFNIPASFKLILEAFGLGDVVWRGLTENWRVGVVACRRVGVDIFHILILSAYVELVLDSLGSVGDVGGEIPEFWLIVVELCRVFGSREVVLIHSDLI